MSTRGEDKPFASTAIYPLWKSFKIVNEMLLDRGYKQNTEDWNAYSSDESADAPVVVSEQEFAEAHADTLEDSEETRKKLCFRYKSASPPKKGGKEEDRTWSISLMTFWKNSLGTNDIHDIHEKMKNEGVTKAIVVYAIKITPYAAVALRNLRIQKVIIETFSEAEMQYNVTKHEYVPRHIICSAVKKAQVLKEYSATAEQIAQIKSSDPVCRYYGAIKGQMIKILRPSDCMPEVITADGEKKTLYDITYRIVV